MITGRWRQCSVCDQLIPIDEWELHPHVNSGDHHQAAFVQGDIETFKSPIDGSIISDRAHLREHNRKHGVTDMRDYSPEYIKKRADARQQYLGGTTEKARRDRVNTIMESIERHGG